MYTFTQVCKTLNISEHTLRYYTNENLIPNMKRDTLNRRIFDDQSIDWIKGIIYLRGLGMSIEDIKTFIQLCQTEGDKAIEKRLSILNVQLKKAEEELEHARTRVQYIQRKIAKEEKILAHEIPDEQNPSKKHY